MPEYHPVSMVWAILLIGGYAEVPIVRAENTRTVRRTVRLLQPGKDREVCKRIDVFALSALG